MTYLNYKPRSDGLKIAYFAGSMKPGHDGVTRVLYKLIDELKERKIKSIFFSPIIPSVEERNIEMIKVPSMTFPFYKDYKVSLPLQHLLEKHLKDFQPDIIHINSPCPLGHAAVKYAHKHHIPVVATYHTHFASYARYYQVKLLEPMGWNYFRSLYNKCDRVFVPSLPIMTELYSHGFNTTEYLPHGVDTELFNPKNRSTNWKESLGVKNKIVLLYAGRLVWEKDLETLARTYQILNARRKDFVFVLAGDGPIKDELKSLMPEAKFVGQLNSASLSVAYASSDIFVFPSTTETFGNVTLEAMASGIPPVCAREGGAYGIIKDGVTGLIAEPRNPIDLAEKINLMLDDPVLRIRMAINAFKFAQEQTWDKIFDKLFASYLNVIDEYKIASSQHSMVA